MHSDSYTRLSSIGKKIPDQTEEMCYLHNDDSVWKLPIALQTHTHIHIHSLQYTQMIMMMTAMMLRLMILNLMTMATCGCIHE